MNTLKLGSLIAIFFLGFSPVSGFAQTAKPNPALKSTAPPAPPAAAVKKDEEAEKKFYQNLRMGYSFDYDGPRFNNFNVTQTQGPLDPAPDYTAPFHSMRLGYAVSPRVIVGFQFGGSASFDPQKGFNFVDIQNFVSWAKMVETPDLELQGVLKVTYPTTAGSILAGKLFAVRAQGNWTIKTALRGWTFTTSTKLTSNFFKNPSTGSTTDFAVELSPYITVDLFTNVQWLFEGSFDANHQYADTSFDFRQGDPDSFDFGPIFTLNSHASITTTLKFYTTNISFETATPYVNFSVAL